MIQRCVSTYALLLSFPPFAHCADSAASFFASSPAFLFAAASAFFAFPATFLLFSPLPLGAILVDRGRCVDRVAISGVLCDRGWSSVGFAGKQVYEMCIPYFRMTRCRRKVNAGITSNSPHLLRAPACDSSATHSPYDALSLRVVRKQHRQHD